MVRSIAHTTSDNYYRLEQQQELGTELAAKGQIKVVGHDNIHIRQGNLEAEKGKVVLASQGDIEVVEGRAKEQLASGSKGSTKSWLNKTTTIRKYKHDYDLAEGSSISGEKVVMHSDNGKILVRGSDIVGEQELVGKAKAIEIVEAANRTFDEDFLMNKKSGVMGTGGIGISIGEKKDTTETDQTKFYAKGSQVGSLTGSTDLIAEQNYKQSASTVSSVKGDVNVFAQKADIVAADDKYESHYKHTMEQKGLTLAINIPAVQAVQAATSVAKQAKNITKSKNPRITTMAAANTGWNAVRAYNAITGAVDATKALAKGNMTDSNVSVSLTYGQQKTVETTDVEGKTANGSRINAGGKVNVIATGAGKASDINIIGSDVSGKKGTSLIADDEVNLLAAEQTHKERSKNKTTGFNAGVSVGSGGWGITAGFNLAKGYANGDDSTWIHSHVGDKDSKTLIQSGADTNIKGTQVRGKGIKVNAENLNIESLQDTMKYEAKQTSASAQVTVGAGASAAGSYGKTKVNADYASVQEQAGIFAGDDGYQVELKGKVDNIGGAIISSADKEKNILIADDFSFKDIQNHSSADANSMGLAGGASFGRDQRSENAKQMNEKYRAGREGETFEQASPNKIGEFGVGLNEHDVHSTDKYALAKLALVNGLANASESESASSTTHSVVSEGQFTIRSQSGQQAIQAVKKSTEEERKALDRPNHNALKEEVELAQSVTREFLTNISESTDEAYRSQFIDPHRMMRYEVDENGRPIEDPDLVDKLNKQAEKAANKEGKVGKEKEAFIKDYIAKELDKGRNIYSLHELSDQERNQLKKVTYTDPTTGKQETRYVVAFNGIFNNVNDAAKFAVQNYVAQKGESGKIDQKIYKDVYFIHNPKANGALAELFVAGYQKFLEGTMGDLGNSTIQAKDLMQKYGKDNLFIGAHSRGTLTINNALRALDTKENSGSLANTKIKMVGPAANVLTSDKYLAHLQGFSEGRNSNNAQDSIRIENHKRDIVGSIIGNNPADDNTNLLNKNYLKTLKDLFGDASSHNCYGLGQPQCETDGYRSKESNLMMHPETTIYELINPEDKGDK